MKNKAVTILFLSLILIPLLYQAGCNSIEPPVNGNGIDTTSHNFTFETWTFGEHSSSVLYDVAIIDENNIWAVGEIYLNDSFGQPDPQAYGVATWDGQIWKFRKLFYNSGLIVAPIRGILVLDLNDIFLAAGSIFHWDGSSSSVQLVYSRLSLQDPNATIEKLWGNSNSSVYGVGNVGSIVLYNGSQWFQIQSGTDVDIHDIWGSVDSETGEKTILAIASFQNYGRALDLLMIDGTTATKLDTTGLRIGQSSIWFKGERNIYVVGDGVFYKDNLNEMIWQHDEAHPLLFKRRIRGNDWNDIFIVGDFGLVSHYNGKTWYHYRGNELPNLNGSYYSESFIGNVLIAVGDLDNGQAIILRGER